MRRDILTKEEHEEANEGLAFGDAGYGVSPLAFEEVDMYTTFKAEFAVRDEALVFHFFPTEEVNQRSNPIGYWKGSFSSALERVAKEHFNLDFPQLKAAYSDELASWWLQADGAATRTLDPGHYAYRFLEKLDKELDKVAN
jgi:hypothetical protein